ncbi:nuclear transport factor 2 family protein [Sediminicola luteus]|uniref:SnoaL-like domain-containing protein n=1 Tax=Sediminicola luteus TaxID=319238 RepID=A0A2A4G7R5_9FLAO|nr:ester cyclase [Sediminicola luteus]PCE63795.1 hypothetical protein B7P33_11020 [Sediminicola luteus]
MKTTDNKILIGDFYTKILKHGDQSLAKKIIHENYIQHSPTVKTGRAGFMEFLDFLSKLPQEPHAPEPFFRIIGEGDFVAVHLSITFMGHQHAVVDLFRIGNGQLMEHWDASEPFVTTDLEHHPVTGPIEISDLEKTKPNKALVEALFNNPLDKKIWLKTISKNLIQHQVGLDDGPVDFMTFIQSIRQLQVHRIIGEGNFVLTQCSGLLKGSPYVFYDHFRLAHGKIVEHWQVKQAIPNQMAHANGML